MTKFNPNNYQGKLRIYRKVSGSTDIHRVYVWDAVTLKYDLPPRGNPYEAYRKELINGRTIRVKATFMTIGGARQWQAQRTAPISQVQAVEVVHEEKSGPLFGEVVSKYRVQIMQKLQETSRASYEGKIRNYLSEFFNRHMSNFTPRMINQIIEEWVSEAKNGQDSRRMSFRHELEVLSAILRYYDEYGDDPKFQFPIKHRHWRDVELNRKKQVRSKDLTEAEFRVFHSELVKTKFGSVLAPLAVVQYYQALRVSEVGAIHWEDVKLDFQNPSHSRLLIQRKVVHTRERDAVPYVKSGFKNSGSYGDIKEQPLFPEAYKILVSIRGVHTAGLIFHIDEKPIPYRTIQHYYDQAFKRAGLPYKGTHVLRHGWTREVYNANPDMDVAKQLLGDKSDEAAKVYAIRRASALTEVAQRQWAQAEVVRNCSQTTP